MGRLCVPRTPLESNRGLSFFSQLVCVCLCWVRLRGLGGWDRRKRRMCLLEGSAVVDVYVCMYVCTYVCMHVYVDIGLCVCNKVHMSVSSIKSIHVRNMKGII